MHNEYIKVNCILDKREKLTLLKYADTDITNLNKVLKAIVTNLMDQCYRHVQEFHDLNKNRKRYQKVKPLVEEQIKDLAFVKEKFLEYFSEPGIKSKEDLFTYIFAFQIPEIYFNEFLYHILKESLKEEFDDTFWNKHKLYQYEIPGLGFPDMYILRDTDNSISTGTVNHEFKSSVKVINDYINSRVSSQERINSKLNLIKDFNIILKNYYNEEFAFLNNPYKDYINELVDNIKVAQDFEKAKQYIKRK